MSTRTDCTMSLKRKKLVLKVEQKLEIIQRLKKGECASNLAQEYNVGRSTISNIKISESKLLNFLEKSDNERNFRSRKSLKTARHEKLDEVMYKWILQKRSIGMPISGPLIQEKALELNSKLGGNNNYKASTGWLKRFKCRYGIRKLNIVGEKLSADSTAATDFVQVFTNLVKEKDYDLNHIYNCDETGLFWKALPRKTLATQDEYTASGYKVSKDRVTAMVCANAFGNHKIPLTVIGKAKRPRCFKNINLKDLSITYLSQKKSWRDIVTFKEWFKNVFLPSVKAYQQENNCAGSVLLLLDNAPAHPPVEDLQSDFVEILYLPPNVTSLLQPMDQSVIETLKRYYRKNLLRRLLFADDNNIGVLQFYKKLNLTDCIEMLSDAWEKVTSTTLNRAWNKLFDNNDTNASQIENDELENLARNIPGFENCCSDDIQEWINVEQNNTGFEVMSDDDIISSVLETSNNESSMNVNEDTSTNEDTSINEETSVNEDRSVNGDTGYSIITTHSEAANALNSILEWAKHQTEINTTQMSVLKEIYNLAVSKNI